MAPSESADLMLALALADEADAITMRRFCADDLVVETKPDMTPVSEADRAVEERLRELLARERPGDAIVGEELGGGPSGPSGPGGPGGPAGPGGPGGGRRWIVDPIDGTKGYVRGMPVWATLLALERAGELAVAVASAPALGARWWAARGEGAFTRGRDGAARRIRVSAVGRLQDAQVCFGDVECYERNGSLGGLLTLIGGCWRSRGFADFWQYMLVAEGSAEIASDASVSLWDLAAPMLIVQEAGGTFTDFGGRVTASGGNALASNGRLHPAALQLLGGR